MARKRTDGAEPAAAITTADPPPAVALAPDPVVVVGAATISGPVVQAGQGRKLRRRMVSPEYVAALRDYSKMLYDGGLVPKAAARPEGVAVLIEIGRDVGLPDTTAVAWVSVINGRPSIYGDAAMALIRASGLLVSVREWFDGEGDQYAANCELARVGGAEPRLQRFSVADAKRARLWGKAGPWTDYPERMLMYRARGFVARDEFPDVLCGLIFTEEAQDMPPRVVVIDNTAADAAAAEPIRPASPPVVILDAAPPAAAPAPTTAEPAPAVPLMTREQSTELDRLKGLYLARRNLRGGTQEATDAWAAFVADCGGGTPRALKKASQAAAAAFLAAAGAELDPAAYPAAEPSDPQPTTAPATAPAPVAESVPVPIAEGQLEEVLRLQGLFFDGRNMHDATTDEARAAWAEFVFVNTSPRGVRSVKHLTAPAADAFIVRIGEQLDPFSYPRKAAG